MYRLCLGGIELAVLHARPRRHPLKFARVDDGAGANAVPMLQFPFEDIRDDLHVPVAVHAKTSAGLDSILVDDPQ